MIHHTYLIDDLLSGCGSRKDQGDISLTWMNFNPNMDEQSHTQWSVGWNYLSIPKLQLLHRWSLGKHK